MERWIKQTGTVGGVVGTVTCCVEIVWGFGSGENEAAYVLKRRPSHPRRLPEKTKELKRFLGAVYRT